MTKKKKKKRHQQIWKLVFDQITDTETVVWNTNAELGCAALLHSDRATPAFLQKGGCMCWRGHRVVVHDAFELDRSVLGGH